MAREIDRVSRQWIIIVPWRYCWIEPHFKFLFFQLLSERIQNALTKLLNLHNLGPTVRNNPSYIRENYQWLSNNDWKDIFKANRVYVLPTLEMIAIVKKG